LNEVFDTVAAIRRLDEIFSEHVMSSQLIGALGFDMTSLPETTTSGISIMTMSPEPCRSEQECKLFTVIVYVFIQGTMFVLGFIGNTLSFIVLQSDRKTHAATFLLQV
jgi:hypothetical protein